VSAAALPAVQDFQRDPQMKTTGIIGGVSWVSTVPYYRIMNEEMRDRYGADYSAAILLYSIPFGEFAAQEKLAAKGDWAPLHATMVDAGLRLRAGGADFIVIASNTMNSTADLVERRTGLRVLRIQDAVGEAVDRTGITRVALLGTKYTMEEWFYRERLEKRYGLTVVTPNRRERDYINDVIFNQLCADVYTARARNGFVRIIDRLVREKGVRGVILGCTEIPRLVPQRYVSVPVFDSTSLHAKAALAYALSERPID
jgi:aspartate racemase